ncbi:MAG: amylo-alpha-1,6-glucosidase [Bacteroidales bacterium]|jgi:predicted glycogen debranching enzyme|nr:amylo-alpha-1,6-glucosidase [Bacteroidales bacterium]
MSYLKFDKSSLVNLEYSLAREYIRTNRGGAYTSTTISGCNTRKYHGLLVCPVKRADGDKHVLLASLDETVIQHGAEFNLGIHKYAGDFYEPKGHKYIRNFEAGAAIKTTFRVGGVVLVKEVILVEDAAQVLIKYTLAEAHSPTTLRFRPFLAFRSVHCLSHTNLWARTHYTPVANGVQYCLYDGYPSLNLQFSVPAEFIAMPDWYNNIEYLKEKNRGYEYLEDLFVPGYFELPIAQGESIIFSASTAEIKPGGLKNRFRNEADNRPPQDSFFGCLKLSAQQFMTVGRHPDIIAGYPWYHGITRQTFIALPGFMPLFSNTDYIVSILDTQVARLKNGLFPKTTAGADIGSYADIDSPLWFFWALQMLMVKARQDTDIWKRYYKPTVEILNAYRHGSDYGIGMDDDFLIRGGDGSVALTWMDSCIDGKPVVPRNGKPVEVNALWYNAIAFSVEMAEMAGKRKFFNEWAGLLPKIKAAFIEAFWDDKRGCLYDCITDGRPDRTIRPNMVIAAAMPHTPLTREMQKSILSVAKRELLTPRGLRSLTPESLHYTGVCQGSVAEREKAIHQGTAWPWLVQFFVEDYLHLHGAGGVPFVRKLVEDFEEDMTEHCIGTIAEMYSGNPPHAAKGAVSQAWSVASIIRSYLKITERVPYRYPFKTF